VAREVHTGRAVARLVWYAFCVDAKQFGARMLCRCGRELNVYVHKQLLDVVGRRALIFKSMYRSRKSCAAAAILLRSVAGLNERCKV
jgi:hypothetical protein